MDSKDLMNIIPLDNETDKLAQDIINEPDIDAVKNMVQLFNLNQAKKNVLRVLKLNSLLDKVQDQMIERFEKKPGEFSNADLLNYMQVTQSAIDRAQKSLSLVDETPAITQVNQVNLSINDDVLSRESRERITEAITNIVNKLKLPQEPSQEEIVIDNVENKQEDAEEKVEEKPDNKGLLNEEE